MKTQLVTAVLFCLPLTLLVLATSAGAQLPPEGLYLTATGSSAGLYELGAWPSASRKSTLALNALKTAPGNQSFIATMSRPFPQGAAIVNVSKSGAMTTVAGLPLGKRASGIAVDQDGSTIIASAGVIYRLGRSGLTTFSAVSGAWQAIDREDSTGGFVAGDSTGRLVSLSRFNGTVLRTIRTNLGTITGVAYNPVNATYVVSRAGTLAGVLILRPSGTTLTTIHLQNARAVTVDEKRGDVWMASTDGIVVQTDAVGTIKSTARYVISPVSGLDIAEDQNVSLQATGEVGNWAQVTLTFRRHLGWRYICALSLGQRPGIPFPGGRVLNLYPDWLFMLTVYDLLPGLTADLHGVIHPLTGQAFPRFLIPRGFPIGLRIYVGAVAWKPGVSTVEVGNVDVLLTQQTPK